MIYPNPQIYHNLKAIFVHNPKAAGTSIERTLASPGQVVGGHTTALGFQKQYPEFSCYFKFAISRDPIARFLSAYAYLKKEPVHPALNNQQVHDSDSPEAFVERLRAFPATLYQIVHLMPQNAFVCDLEGIPLVDQVYKFGELGAAWKDISARLKINLPLPKLNSNLKAPSSPEVRKFVREAYARDYEIFGYP